MLVTMLVHSGPSRTVSDLMQVWHVTLLSISYYVPYLPSFAAGRLSEALCLHERFLIMGFPPGNRDLVNLKNRIQPLFEREEKARKAGLNPVERMKVRELLLLLVCFHPSA